jgi:hypothetical protein
VCDGTALEPTISGAIIQVYFRHHLGAIRPAMSPKRRIERPLAKSAHRPPPSSPKSPVGPEALYGYYASSWAVCQTDDTFPQHGEPASFVETRIRNYSLLDFKPQVSGRRTWRPGGLSRSMRFTHHHMHNPCVRCTESRIQCPTNKARTVVGMRGLMGGVHG